MLLMGLRLDEGIDAARFARRTNLQILDVLDAGTLVQALAALYIEWDGSLLRATSEGRKRLDALLGALVL
jgi:coproporphyrinogen III oxidase-like Fe-S oxidoreductase